MQKRTRLLFVSVLYAALLPVTVWGYGIYDYNGDRRHLPYTGSEEGHHYSGSLRLQRGMTEEGYYVRANIQGLRPEDVQVYLQRNRLVLQIAQDEQHRSYNPDALGASQWQMRFRRQIRLPYDADGTRMKISTMNGIMEIYIPRRSQYVPAIPSD